MTGDFKTEMMELKVRHTYAVTDKAVCGRLMCSLGGMEYLRSLFWMFHCSAFSFLMETRISFSS